MEIIYKKLMNNLFKQKRIMKKTYIAPLMEDMKMEESEMICTSLVIGGVTEGNVTDAESREFDIEGILNLGGNNLIPF